jgi:hypothetical protein
MSKIHAYHYAIENNLDRVVQATLDVSKSTLMKHSLNEPVVTRVG